MLLKKKKKDKPVKQSQKKQLCASKTNFLFNLQQIIKAIEKNMCHKSPRKITEGV